MLLGLISDSHDNLPLLRKAVERFNDRRVDLVLHAGDIISPFCARELKKLSAPCILVFGNNDGERRGWKDQVKGWGEIHDDAYEGTFAGQRLFLKHDPVRLADLAKSQLYDIIIYGHTHTAESRSEGKTLIINPGECGGWLTGKSTIAFLTLPEKKVEFVSI